MGAVASVRAGGRKDLPGSLVLKAVGSHTVLQMDHNSEDQEIEVVDLGQHNFQLLSRFF